MFESERAEEVQAMVEASPEFKRLYQLHRDLDKAVLDAELGVRPIDDRRLAEMKKEKLRAKDRLTVLWEQRQTPA